MTLKSRAEENLWVLECCDSHMRISAKHRLEITFDQGSYTLLDLPACKEDPLNFEDLTPYKVRLAKAREKTGLDEAFVAGYGCIESLPVVVGAMDFFFMGGSMGRTVGERFVYSAREAIKRKVSFVVFTSSGGARMQESVLSLMQMVRTTIALQEMRDQQIPFITALCDPTTGGVLASFGMLGDFSLAEPGSLLAFSGARVTRGTTAEELPAGFQRPQYLKDHGMIDGIVRRSDMRSALKNILDVFNQK